MRFGSRKQPPPTATSDRAASGMPIIAVREATIRSHARHSSSPPARAWPSTAAMIGFVGGSAMIPNPPRRAVAPRSPVAAAMRSWPDEKTTSDPVRTAQRRLAVGFERVDGRFEGLGRGAVEGVAAVRSIDADDQQVIAVSFGTDRVRTGGFTG